MQKKAVLKLDLHDDRQKQKAFQAITTLRGIDQIAVKEQEVTVVGTVDPVHVVERLRKKGFPETQIVSFGPAKEEKKKDGDEKEGGKKAGDNTDPAYRPWYAPPDHLQTYCVVCGWTRRCPCPSCV